MYNLSENIKRYFKDDKALPSFIALLIITLGLVAGVREVQRRQELRREAATSQLTLSVSPSSIEVSPGQTFSLNVNIDTAGLRATAMDLLVNFNSNLLTAQSIAVGSNNFFSVSGVSPSPEILKQGSVTNPNNGNGTASIILGTGPTNQGKSGTGRVAVINLTAGNQIGSATISISNSSIVTSIENPSSNSLVNNNPATVTIKVNAPTPTPTVPVQPTSTPKPTNTPAPGPTNTPTPTPPQNGNVYNAVDDSYVAAGYPTLTHGTDTTLFASDYNSSNIRTAYLKFKLPSNSNITSAQLELTAELARKVEKYIYTTSNSWSESSITYNNKPARGTQVGYFDHLSSNLQVGEVVTIPLDASKLSVDSQGYISLIVDNTGSGNTFEFSSKEGSSTPKLIAEIGGVSSTGTPTPSPTRTPTPKPNATSTPTPTPTRTPTPVASGTPTPVLGDANGDGKVTGIDYVIWLNHYNQTTPNGFSDGDFNLDGKVTGIDYVIWLNHYGV